MTKKELTDIVNKNFIILKAYRDGEINSIEYTDEEIEAKRQYFLSKVPPKDCDVPLKRWHYEIKRVFELNKDLKKCPDMWFYHLEHFLDYPIKVDEE